jgi:hypothetical protein
MGGGLMQLVAYGAQDIYLTGNPQITFFKVVYRRHTNFAVESIEQTFNGQAEFGKRVTATISRNGDLIQQMYLEVVLPIATSMETFNTWTYGVGNALVKQAEIEIGGQLIDRQYGDWMNIWTELTVPEGKRKGYDNMVGNLATGISQKGNLDSTKKQRLYVPLQFWFNRNPGLALPLIALQYHEVKLNLELRNSSDLVEQGQTVTDFLSCKLYVDYIYLDTDERRRFAQVSHEYLIEQVQFTGAESIEKKSSNKNVVLNFNHPVKELIWVHTSTASTSINHWFNYTGGLNNESEDSFETALLQLNGHDRFSVRSADYFRKVQNYEHHTRVPRVGSDMCGADNFISITGVLSSSDASSQISISGIQANGAATGWSQVGYNGDDTNTTMNGSNITITTTQTNIATSQFFGDFDDARRQYIYSYSFALSPEEHQPSGTCNFSRIDNAILQLKYDKANQTALENDSLSLNVYAVNYNVLRIMSGMGGLAYSN